MEYVVEAEMIGKLYKFFDKQEQYLNFLKLGHNSHRHAFLDHFIQCSQQMGYDVQVTDSQSNVFEMPLPKMKVNYQLLTTTDDDLKQMKQLIQKNNTNKDYLMESTDSQLFHKINMVAMLKRVSNSHFQIEEFTDLLTLIRE